LRRPRLVAVYGILRRSEKAGCLVCCGRNSSLRNCWIQPRGSEILGLAYVSLLE
ncbi:hypothetical protein Droror1_Dr00026492, partial [Drosera rotundifolia]